MRTVPPALQLYLFTWLPPGVSTRGYLPPGYPTPGIPTPLGIPTYLLECLPLGYLPHWIPNLWISTPWDTHPQYLSPMDMYPLPRYLPPGLKKPWIPTPPPIPTPWDSYPLDENWDQRYLRSLQKGHRTRDTHHPPPHCGHTPVKTLPSRNYCCGQ